MAESNFSGSSAYTGILNVNSFGGWNLQVRKNSGSGYWSAGASPWSVTINGHTFSGSWTYDFRGTSLITIASEGTHGNYPRPVIGGNVGASWSVSMQSGIGTSSGSFVFFASGTATVPPPPAPIGVDQITPTAMRYRFSSQGDGGSGIIRWEYQYSTTSNFSSGNSAVITGTGTENVSGLTPNTTYYFRSRGVNAVGNGGWSSVISGTTLPATAPGISLTPSLSGQSMSVALTPPGGATGVTKYRVEYRIGTGAATAVENASSPVVVGGLTPGQVYQWRASAFFGTYESPYTDWTPMAQPNPNTQPGDYFDGATAPRGDVTFAWTGAANNSTSVANGVAVTAWSPAVSGNLQARVQRVTGGRSGAYSARAIVLRTGTSLALGPIGFTNAAVVAVGGRYFGSIYVRPSRPQRLAARAYLFDALGNAVSQVVGTPQDVTDTAGWTRLTVDIGTIPTPIAKVSIMAVDVTGGIHSPWLSGEWLDADDAMVSLASLFPYFDGDTPDTASYDYQWLGAANASVSARYELDPVETDPLADPDCPPAPRPPSLPTIPADCIEEVGTWRRYMLQIPSSEVRLWSSTLPTLVLTTGGAAERQVRIRYYPNPDGLAPEMVTEDGWDAELILTYIPPNTEIVMDGVTQLVTASVAGAAPVNANRLLYGTGGVPATWPELRCGIGYVVTLDVPLEAPAGNLDARLIVTQRM